MNTNDTNEDYSSFHNYFKNFRTYNSKSFNTAIQHAYNYAIINGLKADDLNFISGVAFKQKLTLPKFRLVLKSLIPTHYIPEETITNVMEWLFNNYNNFKNLLLLKYVLQWLIGVLEFKLTLSPNEINIFYDFFYYFVSIEQLSVTACKLIYLLTKPKDVSRWYVKQILHIHEKYGKPKHTESLLYLFKTYRPACVPEKIRGYAANKVFGKIPQHFEINFFKAQERISEKYGISQMITNNGIDEEDTLLVPLMSNDKLEPEDAIQTEILSQTKYLCMYHLLSKSNYDVLSQLNTSKGSFILAFGDNDLKQRFLIRLHYELHNAFFDVNPAVSYKEKDQLLQHISTLQKLLNCGLPIVTQFLYQYLIRWDSFEYENRIYSLLEWANFTNFDELNVCVFQPLHDIFISASIKSKCKILNFLANLATNIILTKYIKDNNYTLTSLHKINWNEDDLLYKVYNHIHKVCDMALIIGQYHSTIILSVIQLHDTIMTTEKNAGIKIWKTSTILPYVCLYSSNPNSFCRLFNLFLRHPSLLLPHVRKDILNCLWNMEAIIKTKGDVSFYSFPNYKIESVKVFPTNIDKSLLWCNHFALFCYLYPLKNQKLNFDDHFHDYLTNAANNFNELLQFFNNFLILYD